MSGQHTPAGFGGRTFTARGRTIHCEPKPTKKADGRTNISLGFPFATLAAGAEDDIAEPLAEYLSCPKRAAAPELYEALTLMVSNFAGLLNDADYDRVYAALRKATGAPS